MPSVYSPPPPPAPPYSQQLKLTFPAAKTRPSYAIRTSRGGAMTLLVSVACILLVWAEFGVYLDGIQEQHFSVDPTVGKHLQINIDIAVAMPCNYIHVNVEDAAGDRILAGDVLKKDPTMWDPKGMHTFSQDRAKQRDDNLWDVMAKGGRRGRWPRTYPWRGTGQEACRVFGNMEVNKVQGDFHITARGHGYWDSGQHIEHNRRAFFPFSYSFHIFHIHRTSCLGGLLERGNKKKWLTGPLYSIQLFPLRERTLLWRVLPKASQPT